MAQEHEAVRWGYKWVRPSNPAEELQDEMLRKAGLDPAGDHVLCDRPSRRRLKAGEDAFPELTRAIASLHRGDDLCIPFPQCFTPTEAEAKRRLAAIARFGAALYVASLDMRVDLMPEMDPVLRFLAARAEPFKRQKTEAARTKRAEQQREAQRRTIRRILPSWNNPENTILDVAEEKGVSRFTLSRWKREGLLPPKPRGSA